ncbi:PREDICTED: probable purine permease 10 isoform X2 [Nicotiana attenuata]|uniref:Probable purine permease n=1 Tax=Nicotiana attenuata TaxID=49451 RepID=A0A1J6HZW5_NICAT|nr:PREDICTED: probable purine permease 10 isoform X2 [Nicotiana attenuata]OIS98380.1 putative purine permease 10 [Nicotiana attenuata]
MEGAHEKLLHLTFEEAEGTDTSENAKTSRLQSSKFILWLQIFIFTFFALAGQAVGTLLGRVYYEQGGQSRWIATLVQTAGFPILLPIICYPSATNHNERQLSIHQPSIFVRASVYIFLGLFQVANSMLYTVGVQYLPASTYSLISGSQLAFNALTSFLLNGQKITPLILNSVVLLSFSSSVIMFQNESSDSGEVSQASLLIGFAATTMGSLGYALQFSLTELAFQKVFKSGSLKVVMKMSFFIGLFVTLTSTAGLFASGNWKDLGKEMGEYRSGKLAYVMNLVFTAISWQMYAVGSIGLVFKASSLFSNVIINLGSSVVPIFAMVFLKDKMSGLKVFSLLLGLWGYASYIYQHYLDDLEAKAGAETKESSVEDDDFEASLIQGT